MKLESAKGNPNNLQAEHLGEYWNQDWWLVRAFSSTDNFHISSVEEAANAIEVVTECLRGIDSHLKTGMER